MWYKPLNVINVNVRNPPVATLSHVKEVSAKSTSEAKHMSVCMDCSPFSAVCFQEHACTEVKICIPGMYMFKHA